MTPMRRLWPLGLESSTELLSFRKRVNISLIISLNIVLGAQKNHFIEIVLLSTMCLHHDLVEN